MLFQTKDQTSLGNIPWLSEKKRETFAKIIIAWIYNIIMTMVAKTVKL